jgi:hypothetical protein
MPIFSSGLYAIRSRVDRVPNCLVRTPGLDVGVHNIHWCKHSGYRDKPIRRVPSKHRRKGPLGACIPVQLAAQQHNLRLHMMQGKANPPLLQLFQILIMFSSVFILVDVSIDSAVIERFKLAKLLNIANNI